MSREVRHEVGLDITCRTHPGEVLFWPGMALDESRTMREAGPKHFPRGIAHECGEASTPTYAAASPAGMAGTSLPPLTAWSRRGRSPSKASTVVRADTA
ncbi:hypothetical protein [Micromonospora sp. RTP1Z1]|uniref:hypothetical protein n=1 Tax=Micromonospora sp. RTP1Z1 TaxID=2994043 RepID=UPI0029C7F95D|nr:hypothetical protein [Micromonospora sp. RTP1Z1]